MTSMCLSLIFTPCKRYTSCTSSVMYRANASTPRKRRMSCGSAGPSTMTSPFWTTWPSWAVTCFSLVIRYSCGKPSMSVMTRRCLPLVSLPKDTVPVTSANTPASLGERASNNSATRGRPPVMSRVFDVSCGIRAITSPTATSCPSFTVTMEPIWKVMLTRVSVPVILTSSPASSSNLTCGRTPLAAVEALRLGSTTTSVDKPVTSSSCLATVTPSSIFSKRMRPAYSVMMGRVCGSHVANTAPALIFAPSVTNSIAPYGTL